MNKVRLILLACIFLSVQCQLSKIGHIGETSISSLIDKSFIKKPITPLYGMFEDIKSTQIIVQFFPFNLRYDLDVSSATNSWIEYSYSREGNLFYICTTPTYDKKWSKQEFYQNFCKQNQISVYQIFSDLNSTLIKMTFISGKSLFNKEKNYLRRDPVMTLLTNTIQIPFKGQKLSTFINANSDISLRLAEGTYEYIYLGSAVHNRSSESAAIQFQMQANQLIRATVKGCGANVSLCTVGAVTTYSYLFEHDGEFVLNHESGPAIEAKTRMIFRRPFFLRADLNPYILDFFFNREDMYKNKKYIYKPTYDSTIIFKSKISDKKYSLAYPKYNPNYTANFRNDINSKVLIMDLCSPKACEQGIIQKEVRLYVDYSLKFLVTDHKIKHGDWARELFFQSK